MSPVNPRRTAHHGAKAAAVVAVTGAFVAVIASAATAAPDLRTLVESTTFSGTETTTTTITTTTETSTTSATTPAPGDDAVYADIYVELDRPNSAGPLVLSATNRLVGDGPELDGNDLTSNPNEWCGYAVVDVSLDPATITISGDGECYFDSAYLRVMLHGATFGSVTLTEDSLFMDPNLQDGPPEVDIPLPPEASGISGSGVFGASKPVMTAVIDRATLQSYGAAGPLFTARWEGLVWSSMTGVGSFNWVVGAEAPTVSDANPVFTG